MTEPANVTTGSGDAADGEGTGVAPATGDPAGRGDATTSGPDGDADLVADH